MIIDITIRGFRGVVGELPLTFRRVTLFSGRNGLGKTTVFDAIDWCLFGSASRVGRTPHAIKNLYHPDVEPHVGITLRLSGRDYKVARSMAGATLDGSSISDRELTDTFLTDRDVFPPYFQTVDERLRTLLYLEQAELKMLLDPTAEEQAALFQGLLGVPDAAVVKSAARRVRDRLDSRTRKLNTDRAALEADMTQIRASLRTATFIAETLDSQAIRAQLTNLIGAQPENISSDETLLVLARRELDRIRERRAFLDHLRHSLTALRSEREALLQEASRREADSIAAASAKRESDEQILAAIRDRELKAQVADAAQASMGNAEAALRTSRAVLQLLNRRTQVSETLAGAAAEASQSEQRYSDIINQLREAEANDEVTQRELSLARHRAQESQSAAVNKARYETLAVRRDELRVELEDTGRSLERQAASLQTQEAELTAAVEEAQALRREYQAALAAAEEEERLRALLLQVAAAVRRSLIDACPLCGARYDAPEELRRHIDAAVTSRSAVGSQLAALKQRLDAAETRGNAARPALENSRKERQRLQDANRRLVQELRQVEVELSVLSARIADFSAATPVDEALRAMAAIEAEATQSALRRDEIERNRQHVERSRAQSHQRTEELEAELRTLSVDLTTLDGLPSLPAANARVRDAEMRYAEARSKAQMAAEDLRAAEQREREAQARATRDGERVAGAASALARVRGRLEMLEHEITVKLADVQGDRTKALHLEEQLAEVTARETSLIDAIQALDRIAATREERILTDRLNAMSARRDRLETDGHILERASRRFETISVAINGRAAREESLALEHYRAAIHECFRALLPHAHLDDIEIDPSSGAVNVTDGLLRRRSLPAVRPALYLSSGQTNALALAVFFGIALRQTVANLDFLLLDEPIQNLDDVHFLALITLLKRTALSRQILLSTADANVAEIMRRQMKSGWTDSEDGYVEYEWLTFSPHTGPGVVQRT